MVLISCGIKSATALFSMTRQGARMAGESSGERHGEVDFADACRNVGITFAKGMAAMPLTVGFNLFWGSTALGLRLFEQMVNAGVNALPTPQKQQKNQ